MTAFPWSPTIPTHDSHDLTSGDPREWGADYPLPAGTPIFAPESGTILGYHPSASDWQPGLLLERLSSGAVVGFGHVNDVVAPGTQVAAGQEIGTVGRNPSQGDHTEVIVFPQGNVSHAGITDPRPFLARWFGPGSVLGAVLAPLTGPPPSGASADSSSSAGTPQGLAADLGASAARATWSLAGFDPHTGKATGQGVAGWLAGRAVPLLVAAVVLYVVFAPQLAGGPAASA